MYIWGVNIDEYIYTNTLFMPLNVVKILNKYIPFVLLLILIIRF